MPVRWATANATGSVVEVLQRANSTAGVDAMKAVCDGSGPGPSGFYGLAKGSDLDCAYSYLARSTPALASYSLSTTWLAGVPSYSLSLTGAGFLMGAGNASVAVGPALCAVQVLSDTLINCSLSGVPWGAYLPLVTIPGAGSAEDYQGTPLDFPQGVLAATPLSGSLAGGQRLTITGYGFRPAPVVVLTPGGNCTVVASSESSITCVTPAAAAGAPSSSLITIDGAAAPAHFNYTAEATPVVSSVAPAAISSAVDTLVNITGSGFLSAGDNTTVLVGDLPCAVRALSDAFISCLLPRTSTGLPVTADALLVLVGAVWVGMGIASQIAAPVARLVLAADRVAMGDLSARVELDNDLEEIAVLSHAFNRMTSDLEGKQAALQAASHEAQERRQFIETVLGGVSAGVLGVDSDGCISAANIRAMVLLGLDEKPPSALHAVPLSDAAPEMLATAVRALASASDVEEEVDLIRGADTRRLRVRASVGLDSGLVLTFDDITRLVSAQRNAAWKDVARRIAHEIKNPLTPIQLSAERIRRKYRKDITHDLETFDRCTDTIIRQVGDIGRMVDEFSAFARMPAPKFATEDARELLRQAVFAQRVTHPDITFQLQEPDEALPLTCDARMVGQALTNILKNAGESVEARLLATPETAGVITAGLIVTAGEIVFDIQDNGLGLPDRDRGRLTEPYVTTREKGTGLGLAIVKRILEEHGGELVLTDAAAHPGARVQLRFPSGRRSVQPDPDGPHVSQDRQFHGS